MHVLQMDEFGGTSGIRDAGLLESAVLRPRQRYHYGELKTIVDLAVAYATALSGNHPFVDGNSVWRFTPCSCFCVCTVWRSKRLPGKPLK